MKGSDLAGKTGIPLPTHEVDAFAGCIRRYSEDKKRRMPTNVKTYDGIGDLDDHLKVFEAAAKIERWPEPIWCHMFNSTLIGNARTWFDNLQHRSIEGFEELRKAFRRNFTQRKKYSKNPVELARIRQRSGEYLDSFTEHFKDEMVYFKHCPDLMKIFAYMNGINNQDLIKKLNDKVPQTFDELMRRVRAFIRAEDAAADSRRGYSGYRAPDQPKKQFNDRGGNRRPPPINTPVDKRVGNGFCDYHGEKGHSTDECIQLKKQIEKMVRAGRLDHLIREVQEGRDKQKPTP
ncbi:reverse transcriptase domain-containing protein [Tanacetum coccineum]